MCKAKLAAHGRRILPHHRWATEALLLLDRVISPTHQRERFRYNAGRKDRVEFLA